MNFCNVLFIFFRCMKANFLNGSLWERSATTETDTKYHGPTTNLPGTNLSLPGTKSTTEGPLVITFDNGDGYAILGFLFVIIGCLAVMFGLCFCCKISPEMVRG